MGSPSDSFADDDWAIVYFLAAYGTLFYATTLASFPFVFLAMSKREWTPLMVKQRGLTQIGVGAGCVWFLHSMTMMLVPRSTSDRIIPPGSFSCWFRAFWRTCAVSFYVNAVIVKQYKGYTKYVARDTRLPTYVYMLLLSIPFLLLVSLPIWDHYNNHSDECDEPQTAKKVMFTWVAALVVACMVLVNSLRDTVTYFPNFQASVAEVCGLLILELGRAFELWFPCTNSLCPSTFTRVATEAFLLATVPNVVYWIALGEALWKTYTNDEEYIQKLEQLCSPETALMGASEEPEPSSGAEGGVNEDTTAAPPRRMMVLPNYERSTTGDFFETDRLAGLIDNGDRDAVRGFVLDTNLDLVHILDRDGITPLHRAVQGGHVELTQFLLDFHCDPNVPSKEGERAIHFAARNGDVTTITMLKSARADVNAVSHRGVTPLVYAVLCGTEAPVQLLMEMGAMLNMPGTEVVTGKASWERVHLIDAGRLKNYCKQPLTVAIELGLTRVVESMVTTMARLGMLSHLDTACIHGMTPLMLAVGLGHKDIAVLLLEAGADIWRLNYRDKRNILHYNAMEGSCTIFEILRTWFLRTDPPDTPAPPHSLQLPATPKGGGATPKGGGASNREGVEAAEGSPNFPPAAGGGDSTEAQSLAFRHPGFHEFEGGTDTPDKQPGSPVCPEDAQSLPHRRSSLGTDESTLCFADIDRPPDDPPWTGPADAPQLLAAFLSMPDCLGRTPLHYAVLRAHADLVSMLLAEGANTKARDLPRPDKGCLCATALEYAQQKAGHNSTPSDRAKYVKVWQAFHAHKIVSAASASTPMSTGSSSTSESQRDLSSRVTSCELSTESTADYSTPSRREITGAPSKKLFGPPPPPHYYKSRKKSDR